MPKIRMLPVLLFLIVLCECRTEKSAGVNFAIDRDCYLKVSFTADAPDYFTVGGQQYGYCTEILNAYAAKSGQSLEILATSSREAVWETLQSNGANVAVALTDEVELGSFSLEVCTTGYVMIGRRADGKAGSLSQIVGEGVVKTVPAFQRTETYDTLLDTLARAQIYISAGDCCELAREVLCGQSDFLICEASEGVMAAEFLKGVEVIYRFGDEVGVSLVFSPLEGALFEDFSRWWNDYAREEELAELRLAYFAQGASRRLGRVNRNNRVVDGISVWDDLIRKVGEREGVDWRLLSAIAYKESRFHHDVTSRQGATGLMQIMPVTARHFKVEQASLSDPEVNITLAAKLIKNIGQSLGFPQNVSEEDQLCIILAAYNCGIGTVGDARRLARAQGWNADSWASVAQCLELMGDTEYRCDSVAFRQFRGYGETLAFVDGVRRKYDTYRRTIKQ